MENLGSVGRPVLGRALKAPTFGTAATAALAQRNEQLSRFNQVAVGRELDMIDLKRQVNALSRQLGRAEPFNLAFADASLPPGAEANYSGPHAAGVEK